MGLAAVTVGHFGRQRREAAEVIEGGGMPRRWQMKKVNSALVRRAPWGIEWAARREEAPRPHHNCSRPYFWVLGFLVNSETGHSEDRFLSFNMLCEHVVLCCVNTGVNM